MAYQAIALDSYPTDSRGFNRPSSAPITRTTNWKEDFCPDIDTSSFSNYMEPTPSFIITTIEERYNLPEKACIDTHDARTTLERAVADAIYCQT